MKIFVVQGDQRQGKSTFSEKIREKSGNFIMNQGKKSGNFVKVSIHYLFDIPKKISLAPSALEYCLNLAIACYKVSYLNRGKSGKVRENRPFRRKSGKNRGIS